MIRSLIQAVVCISLCPLLAAQQGIGSGQSPTAPDLHSATQTKVEAINLPRKTEVELALLEPVSSETAQKGQVVRLAVKEDVVVDGTVVIPRGTPAKGLVASVRKAIPGERNGSLRVEPTGLTLQDGSSIKLREYIDTDVLCEGFVNCLGLIVVAIPASLPFAIFDMVKSPPQWGKAPESGSDETLPLCRQVWGATTKRVSIGPAVPTQTRPSQPTVDVDSVCPAGARALSLDPLVPQQQ
jgi:hypothetical protein